MTRLLVLIETYPAASETFLYTTLHGLQQAGFSLMLYARKRGSLPPPPDMPPVTYLPAATLPGLIKLLLVIYWGLRYLMTTPRRAFALFDYMRQKGGRPSLRIAFETLPLLLANAGLIYLSFGGLAARFLDLMHLHPNVIFSLRGSDINVAPLVDQPYRRRLQQALTTAAGVHCVCQDIKHRAQVLAADTLPHARVIYTALNPAFVDAMPVTHQTRSPLIIASVGRLNWRKGFEHGMMAIRALRDRDIDIQWHIAGAGDYEIALRWAVRDMDLEDVVTFTGPQQHSEVVQFLQAADIFFHPAVHEGISNAVLEAMAVGLPVVVCNVGGMSEAIQSGQNGIIVPPRNWQAMADALQTLIHDPARRAQIGQQARRDVLARFTLAYQQTAFTALIEEVAR